MLHPWSHVETNKILRLLQTHLGHYAVVVGDRAKRRNERITPAVIKNELAAAGLEPAQIRIRGIHSSSDLLISNLNCPLRADRSVVPGGVFENHIAEEAEAVSRN